MFLAKSFASEATNLVPNDNNGVRDLFTYRLSDGQISLVSVLPDGTQFNRRFGSDDHHQPEARPRHQ
ncbi:hypothetical protein IV102_37510 [bacterium]|nr:hypothetical protein [bacterium]